MELAEDGGAGRKRNRPAAGGTGSTQGMRCLMARRATTVFVALAAADTVLAGMGRHRLRWLTKPLLMPVLVAGSARWSGRARPSGGAGEVALLGGGAAAFPAGLVSFLAGHVAWITALRQPPGAGRLRSCPALALPYLAAFGSLNAYLW